MAQLMPLPLTVSCFSKIQIGFTFLVPAHPGGPGKRFVKRARACVVAGEENITSEAETNWYCDPEAAHAVLAGLNKVVTLLPSEICKESSLTWVCYSCCIDHCDQCNNVYAHAQ